ncbi:MAG TPA: class I SAM-dependent methyltransferase [Candidatus Onthousia faecipullorum]|uniref:Class I SAM-dependent methyltransferase n=1 Tax=Candidatus Onthousia faecipullorum TaxID=2840887 RepID=A0A9D1GA99_9FIRM|nr:class I SAM-dependent methyltransferase [Candidatus Onthousia faecipullorum]
MSHYFENDQNLPSNLKKTTTSIFNQNFIFYTDNGVFAKHGLDYGSRLLLESLPYQELKGPVLDVGCGYGVLGIIVNKITNLDVDMVDVNKRALHLSKRNIKENKCTNINVFESNCYENVTKKYRTIITNPPIRAGKKIVYDILLNARSHLESDGVLYLVIRKEQGAKSTISDLKKYYDVDIVNKSKGFYIIVAKMC